MNWDALQPKFRRWVLMRGARTMEARAAELPASTRTVYNLMDGTTARPSKALHDAIERVCKVARSEDSTPKG